MAMHFISRLQNFLLLSKKSVWKAEEILLHKVWDQPWVKLPAENIYVSISRLFCMSVFVCRCPSSLCLQFQLFALIFFLLGISCLSCPHPMSPLRCASAFPSLAANLISGTSSSPVPSCGAGGFQERFCHMVPSQRRKDTWDRRYSQAHQIHV